jgi:hypothetical protein
LSFVLMYLTTLLNPGPRLLIKRLLLLESTSQNKSVVDKVRMEFKPLSISLSHSVTEPSHLIASCVNHRLSDRSTGVNRMIPKHW